MVTSTKRRLKQKTPWVNPPENPEDYLGFVYLITHLPTGKKYIGRKYLWKSIRKAVAGKKRRKRETTHSDWEYYTGSCKELNDHIKLEGLSSFSFEILHLCDTRAQTNYLEVKEQFCRDVLNSVLDNGEFEYYNSNILSRYFRGRV